MIYLEIYDLFIYFLIKFEKIFDHSQIKLNKRDHSDEFRNSVGNKTLIRMFSRCFLSNFETPTPFPKYMILIHSACHFASIQSLIKLLLRPKAFIITKLVLFYETFIDKLHNF